MKQQKTTIPKKINRAWVEVDVSAKPLGRVATVIANALRGKLKRDFTPHMDGGDFVVAVNVDQIEASVIVEGANIAVTPEAEAKLISRGVLIVPDVVANAGGVISSYAEHRGYSTDKMFKLVKQKITKSVITVLTEAKKTGQSPRVVAMAIARRRLGVD